MKSFPFTCSRWSSLSYEVFPSHAYDHTSHPQQDVSRHLIKSYSRLQTTTPKGFAPSHPESLAFTRKGPPCTEICNPAPGLLTPTNTGPPCNPDCHSRIWTQHRPPIAVSSQMPIVMSHHNDLCLLRAGVPSSQRKSLALHKSLASSPVSCSKRVVHILTKHVIHVSGCLYPLTSSLSLVFHVFH